MRKIYITDSTLCSKDLTLSFKEKIEIIRQLDKCQVDVIALPAIVNDKVDPLLISTVAPLLHFSGLSLDVGRDVNLIEKAWTAIKNIDKPFLRVSLPVSTVGMEYGYGLKARTLPEKLTELVKECKKYCNDVEFVALDATRADFDFLISVINTACEAGANCVTLCDDAGIMVPSEFLAFVKSVSEKIDENIKIAVKCNDNIGMAAACSISALTAGANAIKTCVATGEIAALDTISAVIRTRGDFINISASLKITELNRAAKRIEQIINPKKSESAVDVVTEEENSILLDINDDIGAVIAAARLLGYDLSEDDEQRVFTEFKRVAVKKSVTGNELDAIIAGTALQVPPTYTLESFLINSSNLITPSAHIKLKKDGKEIESVAIGNGPIDAAFLAIENIIGHHYDLDDFQIQSVTKGQSAVGNAIVRLRSGGSIYSGTGISTDIISACIRAYLNALNKIVYEEANA